MTQPTAIADPPLGSPPPRSRRHRAWNVVGVVGFVLLGVVAIGANFVRVPYVIISPGDATPLDEHVVEVSGARTYEHSGELLFLTVRVSNRDPTVWRWLFAKIDSGVDVTKREEVIGCASYAENARLQDLLMLESQDSAKTVALHRLGYDVVEEGTRIVLRAVACDGPSFGKVELADELTAVDGQPVTASKDVRPLVEAHQPGDQVHMSLVRDGDPVEVTVRAGRQTGIPAHPCGPPDSEPGGKACVGIVAEGIVEERFPVEIAIDTRRVSGPSAGLAFTLAIIDELTPGDLTGGRRVAVTGSILADGHVVPVGGVEQKTIAARRSGATVMLVPACAEPQPRSCEAELARAHADGMRVIVVETIDDALRALERAGGDPIPARPPAANDP
ncbi:MAG: S16 family serine protease [Acidimicrobiia bacterium]